MVLEYQGNFGGQNITQYIQSIMGQAVQLKDQEYINLHGIPAGFWSGDEWSVMSLVKFRDGALGSSKEVPLLGDGTTANGQGFHLGLKQQVLSGRHGFKINMKIIFPNHYFEFLCQTQNVTMIRTTPAK